MPADGSKEQNRYKNIAVMISSVLLPDELAELIGWLQQIQKEKNKRPSEK